MTTAQMCASHTTLEALTAMLWTLTICTFSIWGAAAATSKPGPVTWTLFCVASVVVCAAMFVTGLL